MMPTTPAQYIKVVRGEYEGYRGYLFETGNSPSWTYVQIFKDGKEYTGKIKTYEFELIEPDRRCWNE
jgi:hypothetical protein